MISYKNTLDSFSQTKKAKSLANDRFRYDKLNENMRFIFSNPKRKIQERMEALGILSNSTPTKVVILSIKTSLL